MLAPEEALALCGRVLPDLVAANKWMQRHYVSEDADVEEFNIVMEHMGNAKKVCVMQPFFIDMPDAAALLAATDRLRGVPDLNKCDDGDLVEFYLCARYLQQCRTDVPALFGISPDLEAFLAYALGCVVTDLDPCRASELGEQKRLKREEGGDDDDSSDDDFIADDSDDEDFEEKEEGASEDEESEAKFSDEEEQEPPRKRKKED